MSARARKAATVGALVLALASTVDAQAIVMRHDRPDSRYRDLGETYRPYMVQLGLPGRDGVKRLYGGMGTMIAPRWVLTAGHTADRFAPGSAYPVDMADHEVWIMGRGYRIRAVHLHPEYDRSSADHDIALLELEAEPDGARVACLYDRADERDKEIINVGAGAPGNGVAGVGQPDGALRGGTALVDRATAHTLVWRFREPGDARATDLHGISGPGDSGGPALIVRDGEVCVAGVSGRQRRSLGEAPGTYGVDEVYARVSTHRDWIMSVMSPPAA